LAGRTSIRVVLMVANQSKSSGSLQGLSLIID
jgi:hypothetical protein